MDTLFVELKFNIIYFLLPDKYCYIRDYLNYRLVNKEWNDIINSLIMKIEYSKNLNIYSIIHKNNLGYKLLYEYHCYKEIYLKYHYFLINTLSFNLIKNLPICYFNKSDCIDNLCSANCNKRHHNLPRYTNNNRLMRGIDNKNRHYLLFIYKNLRTNKIFYEFIYHKQIYFDNFNNNIYNNYDNNYDNTKFMVTYSGIFNNTYIGLLSHKYYNLINTTENYRELTDESYDYMKRLIKNEQCGIIKYEPNSNYFYESFEELVTIYW